MGLPLRAPRGPVAVRRAIQRMSVREPDIHEHVEGEPLAWPSDGIQTEFSTAYAFRSGTTEVMVAATPRAGGPIYRAGVAYGVYTEDSDGGGITFLSPPAVGYYVSVSYVRA